MGLNDQGKMTLPGATGITVSLNGWLRGIVFDRVFNILALYKFSFASYDAKN
jgi:hypothetical protein